MRSVIDPECILNSYESSLNLWHLRESLPIGLGKLGHLYAYDVSLPLEHFYAGVDFFKNLLKNDKTVLKITCFGHMGDSNTHLNVVATHYDPDVHYAMETELYQWVSDRRGSISAEHGIGFLKPDFVKYSKTIEETTLMKTLKSTLDPKCILNPHKVLR